MIPMGTCLFVVSKMGVLYNGGDHEPQDCKVVPTSELTIRQISFRVDLLFVLVYRRWNEGSGTGFQNVLEIVLSIFRVDDLPMNRSR
jgi:hypothetical protein